MNEQLSKPFTIEEMHQMLMQWLQKRSSRQSATQRPAADIAVESLVAEHSVSTPAVTLDTKALENIRRMEEPGADSILAKLVRLYLAGTEELFTEIGSALKAQDAEALGAAAHRLKSSSFNLGARQIGELAHQMETIARDGRIDGADTLYQQATEIFPQIRELLEAEIANGQTASAATA